MKRVLSAILVFGLVLSTIVLPGGVAHASSPGTWTPTGSMNVARSDYSATLLPNGKVLVAGGYGFAAGPLASAELFNPSTGTWALTGSMAEGRYGQTATLLPNGEVLVAGGSNLSESASAEAELYDPITGTWTPTGSMDVGREGHTATLLPNGEVLVAGGAGTDPASAELYDPGTGTWALTGGMNQGRDGHTATLLPNGKVLVAGGTGIIGNSQIFLSAAELYDPITGTWTPTGSMNTAHYVATATLLTNGQVLVAGGSSDSTQSGTVAELYSPSTGTWALTGSMSIGRHFHTATLLPNSQVLVAGGFPFGPTASTELYDPTSGTWSDGGDMNAARGYHTATLLPNGQVLVAGGQDNINTINLNSAELFSLPVPLDTTPPTLQLPSTITVDATGPNGATVDYSVTATDPDNAPSQLTVSCSMASGSMFPIGTTNVTCNASDPANNATTGSFTVQVIGATGQVNELIGVINGFGLPVNGTQSSLESQLQAIEQGLATTNTAQSCSDLSSFMSHVRAQSGKHLTADQASQLLTEAATIQKVAGC